MERNERVDDFEKKILTKIFKIKHYFMKIDKEELIKNCSLKL